GWRNRWMWASIIPGMSVVSPRSITSAPGGWVTDAPASAMRSPRTSTSPGLMIRPPSMSRSRAACRTMGRGAAFDCASHAQTANITIKPTRVLVFIMARWYHSGCYQVDRAVVWLAQTEHLHGPSQLPRICSRHCRYAWYWEQSAGATFDTTAGLA